MNVAIILPTIISKNGPSKQALELAKAWQEMGHKVSFFTYAYSQKDAYNEFKEFKVYRCVNVESSVIYKITKNVGKLEKFYHYSALFFLLRFKKLFDNKSIDILNPHDWFGLWVVNGMENKARIVAIINDVPSRENNGFMRRIKLLLDRKTKKCVFKIVVLSDVSKKETIDWLEIPENKVIVVRSGLDVDKYSNFNKKLDIRKILGLSDKSFIIVCTNLLISHRRYEDILNAIVKLKMLGEKDIHVIILSKFDFDSQYANFLREIIQKNNLFKNVHFVDKFFTDEERMAYIQSADLLAFPNTPQSWGLTVIEAMALGVPVIVSTGAGVSEVLDNDKNGIIYMQRNVEQLTKKLLYYIKHKSKLRKIANTGRSYALSTFSWDKFGKSIEKIMKE